MSLGSLMTLRPPRRTQGKTERVLARLIQLSKNKLPVRQESNSGFSDCNTATGDVKAKKFEEAAAQRISTARNCERTRLIWTGLLAHDERHSLRVRDIMSAEGMVQGEGNLAWQRGF
jgi:hypothetical protein